MHNRHCSIWVHVVAITCVLLAQPVLAEEQRSDGDTDHAANLLRARCVFCHSPILMLGFARRHVETYGYDSFAVFLSKHHAPDEEARTEIINFLSKSFLKRAQH